MTEITRIQPLPETEQMSLPDLIKKKRAEKGMTQKELADAAGISVSALKQYETGRQEPTMPKVKQIASVLDLSADDIWSELPAGNVSDERLRLAVSQEALAFVGSAKIAELNQFRAVIEKMSGAENPAQPEQEALELTAFEKLVEAISQKGFKSRNLPKLLANAKGELIEVDDDYLDDLAAGFEIEFPEDMKHEDAVDRVLSAVLYDEDLLQRDKETLDAIVKWANEPHEEEVVSDNGFGLLNSEEDYRTRLCLELPRHILNNASNRRFLSEILMKPTK